MQTHLWGSAFCAPRFRCGGLGIFGVSRQEPVSSAPLSRQQATLLMALLFPKPLNGAQTRLSLHCCLESCIQGIAPKVPKAEISKAREGAGEISLLFCPMVRCFTLPLHSTCYGGRRPMLAITTAPSGIEDGKARSSRTMLEMMFTYMPT